MIARILVSKPTSWLGPFSLCGDRVWVAGVLHHHWPRDKENTALFCDCIYKFKWRAASVERSLGRHSFKKILFKHL